mmetsp:Transcript_1548/g.2482  ORF Transcript_1548/g.2482 Transcript_1548/m.2482 type:complete len:171 (+) Transcript_1548:50-562(+)
MTEQQHKSLIEPMKTDIWRDSPLRLAGYCNEVGEAFAPLFPKFLLPSYGVSVLYVLGDTIDKTLIAYKSQKDVNKVKCSKLLIEAGDVMVWQMLASVIIPGLTIKAVAKTASAVCQSAALQKKFSHTLLKYSPTALGLFTIPFIISPIDKMVDEFMDTTYRPYFKLGNSH